MPDRLNVGDASIQSGVMADFTEGVTAQQKGCERQPLACWSSSCDSSATCPSGNSPRDEITLDNVPLWFANEQGGLRG